MVHIKNYFFLRPFVLAQATITKYHETRWLLKEINLEYSLERLMLKLKLQYFGHLMRRADSLEKTLGKTEGNRRRWQQRVR